MPGGSSPSPLTSEDQVIHQTMTTEDGRQLILVHFIYLSPRGTTLVQGQSLTDEMTWKVACAPNLVELPALASREFPYARTDDPRVVTCPTCKASEQFKQGAMLGAFDMLGSEFL